MKQLSELHSKPVIFKFILFSFFCLQFSFLAGDAEALSQWSRKYKVDCSTCHTSFPRLNYFGEKFMRNGFQWPGEKPDGDTTGKEELTEDLFIDQVGNWFGARLSLTPISYETNNLTRNGESQDSFNVGNTNWLQFFVGGTIFKDVSIFIEQEFESDGSKTSWFHLFFTNLFDTSLVNLQVGRISPVDFTSYSDRLRVWQKSDVLNIKSSNGSGDNSVNIRSSRPGIQYYGYMGPLVLFAGADNGKDTSDTDRSKNAWGGVRLEMPTSARSAFEGSSITFHSYFGTDTTNTSTSQIENDFERYTVSGNLRYRGAWDLLFAYQFAEDDNFDLAATAVEKEYDGFTVTGAYWMDPWYFALQYDQVDSNDIASLEVNKISPSIWWFWRNNFKVGFTGRIDVSGDDQEKHEFNMEIRTMF